MRAPLLTITTVALVASASSLTLGGTRSTPIAAAVAPCTKATTECERWLKIHGGPSRTKVYASHPLDVPNRAITRALVMSPKFMLLDEPFAGIDPIAVTDIQKIIFHLKTRGIGVLITDHNVRETLRITDRAYIVHDGVIFRSGTPDGLDAEEEVKRIYLGTDFRLD